MQIPSPLQETKEIEYPGWPTFHVTFRQATGVDDDAILAYDRSVRQGYWVESDSGERHFHEIVWEPEKVPPEKVRLVLVDCDLEDGGKPLFVAGMSRADFVASWGKLTAPIRNAMYAKCLEVNPDWDPWRTLGANASGGK